MRPQACPDLVRFIIERAAFRAVLLICTSRESFRGSLLEQLLRQRPRPILGGVFLLGRFGLVSRLADHEPVPVAFCHGSDPPSTGTRAATADLIDCAEEAGWLPDHDANERCRCEDECSYRKVNVQSGFAICHQMIHWNAPPLHGVGWSRAYRVKVGCAGAWDCIVRSWNRAMLLYWSWAVVR